MINFNSTGIFGFGDNLIRSGKTKLGADYQTLNISTDVNNSKMFMELFGMVTDEIKTMDKDKNKISVSWGNRNDKDILETVAGFRQNVYNDGTTRHAVIAPYDFVSLIKNDAEALKGKMVTVTGRATKNIYNGKISDRFELQNIYVADENSKPQHKVTAEVFWTKEDIDTSSWKDEKKIYINGYTYEYIDKDNGNKYVPFQVIFDCTKVDFNNEKHVNLTNFKLKQIGLAYENGKIVNNLKNKMVYKLKMILNYVNGAEEIPFDESQLTKNQKEAIELGINTIDDFKPKGSIYGNRVTYYKLINFDLTGDYSDGCTDSGMTVNEFDDEKYVILTGTDADFMAPDVANGTDDSDIDDLFS